MSDTAAGTPDTHPVSPDTGSTPCHGDDGLPTPPPVSPGPAGTPEAEPTAEPPADDTGAPTDTSPQQPPEAPAAETPAVEGEAPMSPPESLEPAAAQPQMEEKEEDPAAQRLRLAEAAQARLEAAQRRGQGGAGYHGSVRPKSAAGGGPAKGGGRGKKEEKRPASPTDGSLDVDAEERRKRAVAAEQRMKAMQARGKGGSGRPAAQHSGRAAPVVGAEAKARAAPEPDALRDLRAQQAEARLAAQGKGQKKGGGGGGGGVSDLASLRRAMKAEAEAPVVQRPSGGAPQEVAAGAAEKAEKPAREEPEMSEAAKAALARRAQVPANMSAEAKAAMDERREKDELLGRIQAVAKRKGVTLPFSLPMSTAPALREYLSRLQAQ